MTQHYDLRIKREGMGEELFANHDVRTVSAQMFVWLDPHNPSPPTDIEYIVVESTPNEREDDPLAKPHPAASFLRRLEHEGVDTIKFALRLAGALQDYINESASDRAADLYRELWGEDHGDRTFAPGAFLDPVRFERARRVGRLKDVTEEVVEKVERESGDPVASALEDLTTATDNVADANRTIALEIGGSLTQAVDQLASAVGQIAEALREA